MSVRFCALLFLASCVAPPPPPTGPSSLSTSDVRVTAVLGTIDSGSGTAGLTVLASLDDRRSRTWSAKLLNGRDAVVATFELGGGSGWATAWWPSVAADYGGEYLLKFETEGEQLELPTTLFVGSGLAAPSPQFEGGSVRWSAVPGAVSYQCASASQSQSGHTREPSCSVEEAAGSVLVRAFNVDLTALDLASLPSSFDIGQRSLSWGTTSLGGFSSHAAIGTLRFGGTASGLAMLVTVQGSGGAPAAERWTVEVTTPGGARISGLIEPGTDRVLMWSYDLAPEAGQYRVVASAQGGANTSYWATAVAGMGLGEVNQLAVTAQGTGGAEVSFAAVPGAAAYYASAWDRTLGTLVVGKWSTETTIAFPTNSFAAGQEVDVYLTASSAHYAPGASIPSSVSMSENTFRPVHYVAP